MKRAKSKESDSCNKPSTGTVKSGVWSNEEIDKLVEMVKAGRNAAEIGDALGRKAASVTYQMYGLRVRTKLRAHAQIKSAMARIPRGPNPLAHDILNLTSTTCRWPLENGFCKERKCSPESPYCAVHRKQSLQTYQKPLNLSGIPT